MGGVKGFSGKGKTGKTTTTSAWMKPVIGIRPTIAKSTIPAWTGGAAKGKVAATTTRVTSSFAAPIFSSKGAAKGAPIGKSSFSSKGATTSFSSGFAKGGKKGKDKGKDEGKGGKSGGKGGPSARTAGCSSVVVKGLAYEASEDELRAVFARCGRGPTAVRILTDRETGESRGTAFVDFDPSDAAAPDEAVKLSETELRGRFFRVDYATPRSS
mmetsp:Transcript_97987/g.275765  ORF Transcript_97987/g.275765 Transcript_97987/m.275765 type:complete len:213 (+) Transcript_97987:79-717(+)